MRTTCVLVALILAGCSPSSSSSRFTSATSAPRTTTPGSTASPSSSVPAGSTAPASTSPTPASSASPSVVLQFAASFPAGPRARIESRVRGSTSKNVQVLPANASVGALSSGSLVLAFGETSSTRALISSSDVAALGSEAFILRSSPGATTTIAVDGPGLLHGSYVLLEEVGFAFLHPLAPTLPAELSVPGKLDRTEAPRWPVRGIHLHTMHPLELTDMLNGWGLKGPNDDAGWRSMLGDWDTFLEWAVANGQNRVEWFLLAADSWRAFADGPVRQARLAELVGRAHSWGIQAGADIPLALKQQHAWYMVEKTGTLAQETAQIEARIDKLSAAGFDFFSTELGTSEFTSTDDVRMLGWLDAYSNKAAALGKRSYAKIHCSVGQTAKNFKDPVSGGPLNYNHLPRVAVKTLGVMPHTVQHYGLDDPAPTYGNQDFDYVRRFLREEAGEREVLWHPETAYWVSFDNDVPLFLPVYAERRVHDLRLLAHDETAGLMGRKGGARMDGQMTFSSGWEWGYWLNDVVTARAAWEPHENAASDAEALGKILDVACRVFGPAANDVRDEIVATAKTQHELLIEGRVGGQKPKKIEQRNAQAYLQGWEAWDDLSVLLTKVPVINKRAHPTQPVKLGLVDMQGPLAFLGPDYQKEIGPLLDETLVRLEGHAAKFDALRSRVPAHARPLIDDLADAARITALRARQVLGLYDYASTKARPRLDDARKALDDAQVLVLKREKSYRVDADRIAGWRENPTCYEYGYVWTVRSLLFWWRDEEKAVDKPMSPFIQNHINPLDVAFGEGFWIPLGEMARDWGAAHGISNWTQALAAPKSEPRFPNNGLRQRP